MSIILFKKINCFQTLIIKIISIYYLNFRGITNDSEQPSKIPFISLT